MQNDIVLISIPSTGTHRLVPGSGSGADEAVLNAVYVEDGKVKRAEFTDVFAALFSRPSSNKWVKVPPAGFEPAHHAPEACALSPELRGLGKKLYRPTLI